MISSTDLQLVQAIARGGSLSAASRTLNVTASAVSQRLANLEQRLCLKLAERSGGTSLAMTTEGELLAARSEQVLQTLNGLEEEIAAQRGVVSGHLKVIAPLGFGRLCIAPLLAKFQAQNEGITLNLQLSDQLGQLPRDSWDIIFRVGPLKNSDLLKTSIAPNKRILCASPQYLEQHSQPSKPSDLNNHRCIAIREDDEDVTLWRFQNDNKVRSDVRINPDLACNDGEVAKSWALSGRGITLRSEWSVIEDIKAGRLVDLLPKWNAPDAPIVALTHNTINRPARVQLFLSFVKEQLGEE
ncbi:MAG: LysR substrate-binding domain-containing protein [Halopseudomonas aestusnigri]